MTQTDQRVVARPRRSGLIGWGIGYSLSPQLHQAEAAALGLDLSYDIFDVRELGIDDEAVGSLMLDLRDEGVAGYNVTYPYKRIAFETVAVADDLSSALEAVNTVVFDEDGAAHGYNTDAGGFGAGLDEVLTAEDYGHVIQFGAGGAGSATAYAVLRRGASQLTIVDPNTDRASHLIRQLAPLFPTARIDSATSDDLGSVLPTVAGVVNASPVGSVNSPGSVLTKDQLKPSMWVADVVYRPLRTKLIELAESQGSRVVDGGRMFVHQAAMAFELINDLPADTDRMRAHFVRLINDLEGH
ncbi:shikimate dehydrogenase [Naasia lichenicola]|uniref:Shikimate dehydrogenase n=1 Tax=Naasia lichenicola TaxID=2565933 RepID=A0A4S4FH06_9MICO|nr:shikimate dehydrogenase [Naasia lichenicola]THG29308.1 shikimate dehydrogenase [Naasia lichenicola]